MVSPDKGGIIQQARAATKGPVAKGSVQVRNSSNDRREATELKVIASPTVKCPPINAATSAKRQNFYLANKPGVRKGNQRDFLTKKTI